MNKATMLSSPNSLKSEQQTAAIMCGMLVDIDSSGVPVVEVDGIRLKAKLLSHLADSIRGAVGDFPVQVVVTFADDTGMPIVVGVVEPSIECKTAAIPASKNRVMIDGETIELTARKEVELRCGKSSIRLTKDGKILIKGAQIISRAARSNKVKGSTVQIN